MAQSGGRAEMIFLSKKLFPVPAEPVKKILQPPKHASNTLFCSSFNISSVVNGDGAYNFLATGPLLALSGNFLLPDGDGVVVVALEILDLAFSKSAVVTGLISSRALVLDRSIARLVGFSGVSAVDLTKTVLRKQPRSDGGALANRRVQVGSRKRKLAFPSVMNRV